MDQQLSDRPSSTGRFRRGSFGSRVGFGASSRLLICADGNEHRLSLDPRSSRPGDRVPGGIELP